jgi:hypothetical protein
MIAFDCPECGGRIAGDRKEIGLELICPRCDKMIPVPWEDFEKNPYAEPNPPPAIAPTLPPPNAPKSLVPCSDCGNPVSKRAKSCPKCGAPVLGLRPIFGTSAPIVAAPARKKTNAVAFGCIAILGVVVLMAIIGGNSGTSRSGSNVKPNRQVSAGIRTSVTHLIVGNKDSADWTEKTIYLNGTPPFTFKLTIDGLRAGETVSLPLIQFTKKNGDRFDPYRMEVKEVWIGGDGYDYIKYGF